MRRVFLSFLGMGTKKNNGLFQYNNAVYELDGIESEETEFVQVAEIRILGPSNFDMILIVATQKSYDTHFKNLRDQLLKAGANELTHIIISEDMSPEGQWAWFEKILDHIEYGDGLTIDLTHGYRSIPIVFSTAINFLQKTRGIILDAVYYGAYDKDQTPSPIINMKDFYIINEWADAVSRLVEDADARKLAKVAENTTDFQVSELNDEDLVKAFGELTEMVRNVDINNIEAKANKAIKLIEEKEQGASITGRLLLRLVLDKFTSIATRGPSTGMYDSAYFLLQLKIIDLLLRHKLFMQAYTVMREFVGSIGMMAIENAGVNNSNGRKRRRRFAEVFVNMVQFPKHEWAFKGQNNEDKEKLMPFYRKLGDIKVEPILRGFSKDLVDYRNGFDHAWTLKKQAYPAIEEKGEEFFKRLKEVVHLLKENNILV